MKTPFFPRFRLDPELKRLAGENAGQGKPLKLTLDVVFRSLFAGDSPESRIALRSLLSDCIHRPVRDLFVREQWARALWREKFEAARRLKAMGIPPDKIAAGFGLPPEDIEAL
jgi:hypothetical protein